MEPFLWKQLARSMVQGKIGSGHEISSVRTSKTAWLSESLDPFLPRLSERIKMITGLETNPLKHEAELLQVRVCHKEYSYY